MPTRKTPQTQKGKTSKPVQQNKADIPTYQEMLPLIKQRFLNDGSLGLILVDASKVCRIEHDYGRLIYGDVLNALKQVLIEMKAKQIRTDDLVVVSQPESDQFMIFLARKRDEKKFQSGDLENLADRLMDYINQTMFRTIFPLLKKGAKISIGYAFIIRNALIQEERLIQKLIEDAKVMTEYQQFKSLMRNKEKLQELIIKEEIGTCFQPIVNMVEHKVVGYEALSRGPKGTPYESPYFLFTVAEETGLMFELDNLCRRKAFINAQDLKNGEKLFVNILPASIHDPEFRGKYLKEFLAEVKISAENIVLEVSEKEAIENFSIFRATSKQVKDIGFAIAVDDTGMGYSNFESLLQLAPDFIKLDISMIHEIDKNKLKQGLVRAIGQIAASMNTQVIAEGIETKEEYIALLELGITFGQGFFFARPASLFPEPKFE
ncbi:MAG: EAL domain-containing protein [Pseudomonadota bacterium]